MNPVTMIIDDDPAYARALSRLIEREGFRAAQVHSGEEALEQLAEIQPDLVLVDLGLPGIQGVDVILALREREPDLVCIAVSGQATVEAAVAAMHAGALDFITKSSPLEEIQFKLHKGLEVAELRRRVQFFREQERARTASEMIGQCAEMAQVHAQIEEIAATPSTTVLILGETGTGKELVARAIHNRSARRDSPLVPVNCTAIPENLAESELFGHERGAFTGADRRRKGLLELADKGSLFLDEIGDLNLGLQGKLLRVMEEQRFRRVGGVEDLRVDVRFMTATNRDLDQLAAEGLFRSDLLYRLDVFQITLPPLRERGEDILLLARFFIRQFNTQLSKDVQRMAPEAERYLLTHPLPGNVRQLRNLVEQAMILTHTDTLSLELISGGKHAAQGSAPQLSVKTQGSLAQQLSQIKQMEQKLFLQEKRIYQGALQSTQGNKSKAARQLEISRFALQRRLKRFDLE